MRLNGGTLAHQVNLRLPVDVAQSLKEQAAALGMSQNIYVAMMIKATKTDDKGRPLWFDECSPDQVKDIVDLIYTGNRSEEQQLLPISA